MTFTYQINDSSGGLPPIQTMIATVEHYILAVKGVKVKIVLNESDISNELLRLEIAFLHTQKNAFGGAWF